MSLSYSNPHLRALYYRSPRVVREWFAMGYSLRQRSDRFGGVFSQQLAQLKRSASRSTEAILEDQLVRLKRTLLHAGKTVPYYRMLFHSIGFAPDSIQSIADLERLPTLEKETMRRRQDELGAESGAGRTISLHTSGTTGKALQLSISQEANQRSYACMWFHYGWAGVSRGDRFASLSGQPIASPDRLRPPFWVHDRLENELLFSSQHITPHTLPLYAQALADFKPAMIRGYPSSIYLVALHLLEVGRKDVRPKAVFTSSETLFDFQRRAIEEAFACKAYSYYGNAERAAHILQCPEGNFHIATETCVVEILGDDGSPATPGESGHLVLTSLINPAMPLIRYRIGDTGVAASGSCSCGRNSPILSSLTGRAEDFVVTPDGRHVGRLDHAFKAAFNVREAQIIQETIESIDIKIVPRREFQPDDIGPILDELRLRLGHEIAVRVLLVESIPRTSSGKFRFVISRVPLELGRNLTEPNPLETRMTLQA